MAEQAKSSSYEDNVNGTLDARRAAHHIGQQMQSTAIDQWQHMINLWHPCFQAASIWQKAMGDGFEAMANKMRQETSKLYQSH